MLSIFVLYIGDNFLGNSLELMRKICEPASLSKPHVTVRGPIRKTENQINNWANNKGFSQLDILGPGCFFINSGSEFFQNTVYIKCFSEEIFAMHYKPDYIASRLHITLYDGKSRKFAKKLLDEIVKLPWGFRVHFPKKYDSKLCYKYPQLAEIKLNKNRVNKKNKNKQISNSVCEIYKNITGSDLLEVDLINFTDDERISLVVQIYKFLEQKFSRDQSPIAANDLISGEIIDINNYDRKELLAESAPSKIERPKNGRQLKLFEEFQSKTKVSKPQNLRNKLGQFPTPPEFAVEITQYVKQIFPKEISKIDFGDPAIGTGTFFYALEKVFTINKVKSAYGIEVDKEIAEITNDLWSKNGLNVIADDFFDCKNLPKRNLILCNPPYIRHQYLPGPKKKQLKERVAVELGLNISGMASLYAYFMLLCHHWMQPGAIAAWLVPSEFLEVNYGSCLREYLTEKVTTVLIHRYDPEKIKFEGVLVTSSVVIIKNIIPTDEHRIKFSFGESLLFPKRSDYISIASLKNKSKWNRNIAFGSNMPACSSCLNEYFQIKRGIATGANSFFILPRKEAERLGISSEFLRPILPNPRNLKTQIVQSDHEGYPCVEEQLSLIDCSLPEFILKEKYPDTWGYLEKATELNVRDNYLVRKRKLWYRQEQREVPLYLCTYFGRTKTQDAPLRFIWNQSKAIATNVYLLLYPKGKLENLLKEKPHLQEMVFNYLCSITKKIMENAGRVYGGGLFKLEPRELGLLPAIGIDDLFKD